MDARRRLDADEFEPVWNGAMGRAGKSLDQVGRLAVDDGPSHIRSTLAPAAHCVVSPRLRS